MTYKQKYNDLVGKYDLLARQYENLKNKYIDVLKMAKESTDKKEVEQLRKTKGEQNGR